MTWRPTTVSRSFHWTYAAASVRFAEVDITTLSTPPVRLNMKNLPCWMPSLPRHEFMQVRNQLVMSGDRFLLPLASASRVRG